MKQVFSFELDRVFDFRDAAVARVAGDVEVAVILVAAFVGIIEIDRAAAFVFVIAEVDGVIGGVHSLDQRHVGYGEMALEIIFLVGQMERDAQQIDGGLADVEGEVHRDVID